MGQFGSQSITLRSIVYGARGFLGVKAEGTPVDAVVKGCLLQPATSANPTGSNTEVLEDAYVCIVPPVSAVLSADAFYQVLFNSETYEITGFQKKYDLDGTVHHVVLNLMKHVV